MTRRQSRTRKAIRFYSHIRKDAYRFRARQISKLRRTWFRRDRSTDVVPLRSHCVCAVQISVDGIKRGELHIKEENDISTAVLLLQKAHLYGNARYRASPAESASCNRAMKLRT